VATSDFQLSPTIFLFNGSYNFVSSLELDEIKIEGELGNGSFDDTYI